MRRASAGRGFLLIASWAGALVLLFYVLWGFNYSRVGLEKQLGLEVSPLDPAEIKAEAEGTARALEETRASIPGAANFLGFLACESSADHVVRYSGLLSYWEYVFSELVRERQVN
jgi:hypothetical protein